MVSMNDLWRLSWQTKRGELLTLTGLRQRLDTLDPIDGPRGDCICATDASIL